MSGPSVDSEWFKEKVASFKDEDVPILLEELRKLDRESRKKLFSEVDFEDVVRALSSQAAALPADGADKDWENFVGLIRLLFEFKNASESFGLFNELCITMTQHKSPALRTAGISAIQHFVDAGAVDSVLSSTEYLCAVAELALHKNLEVAAPAVNALTKLMSKGADASRAVFLGPVGEVFKEKWKTAEDVARIRLFTMAVDSACVSEESLKIVIDSRLLFLMQEWLESDRAKEDPLVLVNVIECFGKLSKVDWGYSYMVSSGVLFKLEDFVMTDNLDAMQRIIMPELYELFGNLCQNAPEKILHDCCRFIPHVLKLVTTTNENPHIIRAEIAMIGQVATKPPGKIYLSQLHDQMTPFLDYLKQRLHSGAQEDKMCVLDTTAALVFLKADEQSDEFCRLTKMWFEHVVTSVRHLNEICSEPFAEIVMPAMQLLLVVSQQEWGRQCIVGTPGLIEWLLNRQAAPGVHKNTGSGGNPTVLRAKHDVAKVLSGCPDLGVAPELRDQLADFVQRGPFFLPGQYEVAVEAPGN